MDILELAAASGEIDLKYLDESGFSTWSDSGYTYYQKGEQKNSNKQKDVDAESVLFGYFSH
jgi:putative transposase